jgi:hypothetical protein
MRFLQSQIARGEQISTEQADANLRFAQGIRDNPQSSDRDRLRAMELIEAMVSRAIPVAMDQNKNDRIDSGQLTENAGLTFNLIPVDPPEVPNQSTPQG